MVVTQRFRRVEIEINSQCDTNCWGCDRFVDVAPAPPMTVDQLEHFIAECIELDWQWDRIHILGGEPTIHPRFMEIMSVFIAYRDRYHPKEMVLRVISNGLGQLKKYHSCLVSQRVSVHVEGKVKGTTPKWFRNIRLAPKDEKPEYQEVPPCSIFGIMGCGLGLTRHGFFLCGAGASIARMIGADIGVMSLHDLTYDSMLEQAKTLCCVCGHWDSHKRPHNMVTRSGEVCSPFWQSTIARYKSEGPFLMKLYGKDG